MRSLWKWFRRDPIRAWLWVNFGAAFALFCTQITLLLVRGGPSHCFGLHYTGLGGLLAIGAALSLLCANASETHALRWFAALRNVAITGMLLCFWRMGWSLFPAVTVFPFSDLPMIAAVTPPSRRLVVVAGTVASALASPALLAVIMLL